MNNALNIIALLALTSTTSLIAQTDTNQQLVVPLTDAGKPGFLEVSLVNGSIHVVGYNGKELVIDAAPRASRRDDAESDKKDGWGTNQNSNRDAGSGMKRIAAGNALDVSAEERNNRVRVSANSLRKPIDLTIKVPQRCSLKLIAVNNGSITVDNVTGELEVSNVNGAITLTNISGSAVAQTVNGDLKTTFREVSSNAPMAFSTLNGNVDVTFPTSVKANVKLKSDQGDIFSDFDIDVDKSQPKATRSSQTGMYRVTVDDWVYGKINNGGPEVMMKNMHGSIYVRKAK